MRRSRVAAVALVAVVTSVTLLFGAPGASIRIVSPKAGARVSGEIDVVSQVSTSAAVSYVLLCVDGERPASTNSSPYRFLFDTQTLPDGPHRLWVEAYDTYGVIGASKQITVHVKNGVAPVVTAKSAAKQQTVAKSTQQAPAGGDAGQEYGGLRFAGCGGDAAGAQTAVRGGPRPRFS
jgi:hypothetical protein